MKNSSLKLLNNSFHDLWDSPTTPTIGAGVYVLSDFDQNDRTLKVGNGVASGTSNGTNTFTKSINGIYSEGEMNFDINKNTFGTPGTLTPNVERLRLYSIGIKRSGNKTVIIENKNKFTTTLTEFGSKTIWIINNCL